LSVARDVGVAVRTARRHNRDPVEALLEATNGRLLLAGRITEVERRTSAGFARGRVVAQGGGPSGGRIEVEFQNENLTARIDEQVVVTVPDLICIVSSDEAEPITTEMLRYGQRVAVVGIPCHPMLTTSVALAVVGPRAFGYPLDFARWLPEGAGCWYQESSAEG
jgi:DUF917 family protein